MHELGKGAYSLDSQGSIFITNTSAIYATDTYGQGSMYTFKIVQGDIIEM